MMRVKRKVCSKCGVRRPLSDFHRCVSAKDGHNGVCKFCKNKFLRCSPAKRNWHQKQKHLWRADPQFRLDAFRRMLRIKHGLTYDRYCHMWEDQYGKCAICGKPLSIGPAPNLKYRIFYPVVDHNHSTGAIRGLLCSSCNSGIGYLQDRPEICDAAAKYLRRVRQSSIRS